MSQPTSTCPICQSNGAYAYTAGDTFYEVTDFQADMHRCENCAGLYQDPIPAREVLAGFYPSGYWQEGEGDSLMARLQSFYIESMLAADPMAWVRRMKLPAKARYLDVGCSRGDWLAHIAKLGFDVAGLEADSRAADYAESVHGLSIQRVDAETWRPEPAAWDGVSAFHLLEHVRDPADFLAKCHHTLKPGGKLLLRVPNEGSWQARLLGKAWKGLEIPRHIVLFNPKALSRLLERCGFKVTILGTWSLRDGPPALASSLLPNGEPTLQQVQGVSRPMMTLAYLALNWLLTPLEILAALCGRGSMITVIAERR